MGRPKGSKNKVKTTYEAATAVDKVNGGVRVEAVATKRTRRPKALGSDPLAKLTAAGLTLDDLKALLGVAAQPAPVAEDKAELRRQMMTAPISPAEVAKLRKEAAANMALVKDPQAIVQRAVDEVVKPNWPTAPYDGAGLKHFLVKTIRNGDSVSFDKERWDLALKTAGIKGVFNTCKPEGSADVDPQTGQRGGSMSVWRVMIG